MSGEEDTKIVKFNVGGTRYEVARSLIEMHPDTMLARMVSEQWQKDPSKEIFIERDGSRFKYVLDYLRDGKVSLPFSVCRESFLTDLQYFSIAYEKANIAYQKAPVYIATLSIGSELQRLEEKIKESESKTHMLRFAQYCLLFLLGSPKHTLRASAMHSYLLSKMKNLVIENSAKQEYDMCSKVLPIFRSSKKAELLEICEEFGFVLLGIQCYTMEGNKPHRFYEIRLAWSKN